SADKVRAAIAAKRPVPVKSNENSAGGTVNLSVVDSRGAMAAMTLTHGEAFGARVTIPGLGILLGHGVSRFEAVPGRRNSIAPGKRPLDNMCPSIVLKGKRPILAIGGVGSRRIPNAVFEVLLKLVADGSSLEAAATEPRIHTEGGLELYVEPGRPAAELDYLKQVGYKIKLPKPSFLSAVQIDPSDPTRPAVGFCDYASEHTNPPGNRNPHVAMYSG
ncbi:MAG TPA: gamma-glutamyltransferase, partial [Lacipirellulaceae bacterium]|nr:gamma-glutamyltransferase [Lacipirellulaceae bacterium]